MPTVAAVLVQGDRRRGPRRSEIDLQRLLKLAMENEARVRLAHEALERGDLDSARDALSEAIASFPTTWALRADYVMRLREELEELRESLGG